MADVVVVGSLIVDLVTRVDRRPAPGETIVARDLTILPGGKGFNQAVAAARSGASVALIGAVGTDPFADLFAPILDTEGIDARLTTSTAGTGIAMPTIDPSGQNTIIVAPRANDALSAADITAQAGLIASAVVLVVGLETNPEAVLAAARIAHAAGVAVICNPAPIRPLPAGLLDCVDLLVPNEHEAAALTGLPANAVTPAAFPIPTLITFGDRGAVLPDGTHLAPYHVPVVDSTGAGDAVVGALAARLAAGDPLPAAARYAMAAGALAVTVLGAEPSLPRRAAITALLAAS